MLKLKDEVELNVLESYGFTDNGDMYSLWRKRCWKLGIYKKSRVLRFNGISRADLDVLFDMINDDMFEKIPNDDYRSSKNDLIEKVAELEARIKELEG